MRPAILEGIPELPEETDGLGEAWHCPGDYFDWIYDGGYSVVSPDLLSINDACGTLLDLAAEDYFDAEKCKALKSWIEERRKRLMDERLVAFYDKLYEFACRAIKLGAGVIVLI